jgi:hypothetical protein
MTQKTEICKLCTTRDNCIARKRIAEKLNSAYVEIGKDEEFLNHFKADLDGLFGRIDSMITEYFKNSCRYLNSIHKETP